MKCIFLFCDSKTSMLMVWDACEFPSEGAALDLPFPQSLSELLLCVPLLALY